jgi:iron complex transport system ATP-binding protein
LKTIAKVLPGLDGQIHVQGKTINQYQPDHLAKEISVVLTNAMISKNLTVREVVTLGRQPYTNWIGSLSEKDNSKINSAIEMLDLKHLAQNKCYELSDGQLQRVMIARALAQDTSIIILDEPTTHLDLYHKVRILKLLKSIAHNLKKTVLFTSHEIELALQLCDKMLVLDNNENLFGEPSKLIVSRAFENLFPKDTLIFEPSTRTYKIQK